LYFLYCNDGLEGKISGVKGRGRPRRACTDDLKEWTRLRDYSELKRTADDESPHSSTFYLRIGHQKKKKNDGLAIYVKVLSVRTRS